MFGLISKGNTFFSISFRGSICVGAKTFCRRLNDEPDCAGFSTLKGKVMLCLSPADWLVKFLSTGT